MARKFSPNGQKADERKKSLEKEKKTWKFFSWNTLCSVLACCLLNAVIWIGLHGFPLMGIPEQDEVESVSIFYSETEEKTIADRENIDLLLKACNLLNYQLWGEKENDPVITVVYHLKNGEDRTIKANGTTVWWRGKSHSVKQKDVFVNILQGLFLDKGKP